MGRIPANIDGLIRNRTIESNRVEYKAGWNPERIMHTICAFANDYEDSGGGYIIIGVEEEDSRPREVKGVTEKQVNEIPEGLQTVCNLIEPRYFPVSSEEEYEGRTVYVIWAPAGEERPYQCPVSLSSKKGGERGHYIRHMSSTVRANRQETMALMRTCSLRTFDDLPNSSADDSDIAMTLVEEYLRKVGSGLHAVDGSIGRLDLLRNMRLVQGPDEDLRPLNVALMMFNDHPEDFFPYAWIDIIVMPDPAGDRMMEKSFKGPVFRQLEYALEYIRWAVVEERIYKVEGRAEALHVFNYPYEAVEEMLVNAVYHKDYAIGEQVTVTVRPDRLEIKSFPGPWEGISDEDLGSLNMAPGNYRNKRLGDYLKELDLAEGRGSGIPKIIKAVKRNGSPMPVYTTTPSRAMTVATLPINERFKVPLADPSAKESTSKIRTSEDIRMSVVGILERNGCLPVSEIARLMGYPGIGSGLRRAVKDLMADGTVVYLYPDTPRRRDQRICLAEKK